MATTTTKLGLRKPDPNPTTGDLINVTTDINNSMDTLDAAVGTFICTSGTRPTAGQRWDGREIYETDTRRRYMWSQALSTWLPLLISRGTNGPYLLGTSTDTTGEGLNAETGLVATHLLRFRVVADTQPRFQVQTDGQIGWGPGNATADTILSRTAANELSTGSGDALKVSGDYVCGSSNGINGFSGASGVETTSSATYINWGTGGGMTTPLNSFSFTKRFTSTRIRIDLVLTYYSTNADTGPRVGVNINATDYDVTGLPGANSSNGQRVTVAGIRFISGIAAGTYTITGRWKREAGGTGTMSRNSTADWVSLAAMEVSN